MSAGAVSNHLPSTDYSLRVDVDSAREHGVTRAIPSGLHVVRLAEHRPGLAPQGTTLHRDATNEAQVVARVPQCGPHEHRALATPRRVCQRVPMGEGAVLFVVP